MIQKNPKKVLHSFPPCWGGSEIALRQPRGPSLLWGCVCMGLSYEML